ncbi:MAG: ABC transporter permease [Bdellovibrionales bacterium]|nr:ABC transporter permease [Bdellovibrionales bacterium]
MNNFLFSLNFRKYFESLVRSWRFHTVINATTLAVLSGSFTIVVGALVAYKNVNKLIISWDEKVQLSVYLDDQISTDEKEKIEQYLNSEKNFSQVSYLSKTEARKLFENQMNQVESDLFLEDEEFNPLPASFEASLSSQVSNKINFLKDVADHVSQMSGVDDISYGQGWVDRYSALVNGITKSGLSLIVVLMFGSILVIGNSIRSSVFQRIEEIKIMELVGATQIMVRAPFVFEGAITGAVSGALALFIGYLVTRWQSQLILDQFGLLNIGSNIEFLSFFQGMIFVLMGAIFGALGSYLCVQRINSGWANSSEN